jgi:pimeloyl-ACP methyl ester carboxylesterase
VDLFDRQIGGVLDALGLQQPATLCGYSMGGAIAISFAARHPQRVARLVLFAPAGLPFAMPVIAGMLRIPLLGELLIRGFGRLTTLRGMARLLAAYPALAQEYVAKIDAVIGFPGYYDALLSTLRHYPLNGLQDEWRTVGARRIPTLLLWGEQDRTVPFPGAADLQERMPAARLHSFPREDHGIPMTVAGELSPMLLHFLEQEPESFIT